MILVIIKSKYIIHINNHKIYLFDCRFVLIARKRNLSAIPHLCNSTSTLAAFVLYKLDRAVVLVRL